ncbi:MAG TPA: galactokinase [Pirellulales bacterium]|nr:galactokinase [Pirellulales bacterium]
MPEAIAALETATNSADQLREEAANEFRRRYSREPQYLAIAPGRVNIIGEHTDYNGGFVLPMAIERYVVIAAAKSTDHRGGDGQPAASVFSMNKQEAATLQVAGKISPGPVTWSSYVQGVIAGFVARGFSVPAFEAVILSNVPLGGGLSSSAALEVATATLLEAMLGKSLEPVQKALLCQEAEHQYAGVPCGIMDQFSSVLCTADHLMLLDCRSQQAKLVPFTAADVTVLIANSNVKHELTGGEYAQRRVQCEAAAKVLGVDTLRDATVAHLEAARDKLGNVNYRRARHVIGEIDRTEKAALAISAGRWNEVGQLMYASHNSLSDDYEVSCAELDLLVALAQEIGQDGAVIGSRMTGGGFGGCTVSLVKSSAAANVAQLLYDRYHKQTGIKPALFTSRPAQGARAFPSRPL